MSLDLVIVLAGQSHIKEVLVVSQFTEGDTDVALEVVPPQTELFAGHLGWFNLGLFTPWYLTSCSMLESEKYTV